MLYCDKVLLAQPFFQPSKFPWRNSPPPPQSAPSCKHFDTVIYGQMDAQRQEESLHAPLGQHARSVMTEAMPKRFVDEVGAHIASALAIAAFKGMVRERERETYFAHADS